MDIRIAPYIAALLLAAALPAQQSELQFEVASVRPASFPSPEFAAGFRTGVSANPCTRGALAISGTRVSLEKVGICDIIRIAYELKGYQVVGIPASIGASGQDKMEPISMGESIAEAARQPAFFYDIEARAPGPTPPTQDQAREMMRALLADRFHLKAHRDQRELSYYALVPAKNGPKLTPAVEGCKVPMTIALMAGCGQTMEQIARHLNSQADKMVLDMTGISEKFDYQFPIDRSQVREGRDFGAMVTAVQDGLKLKVELRKGPIDVLVVDHVERPSEN